MTILGIKSEAAQSIIFDVEDCESNNLLRLEIAKSDFLDFWDCDPPKSNYWVSPDSDMSGCLIDAASQILKAPKSDFSLRPYKIVGYRLFRAEGGTHSCCVSQIGNIENFMKKEIGYVRYEPISN